MILAWGAKVSPEFRYRLVRIAWRIGCDPSWLMACMAFETGRTFSPSVKNPGSSATGLIQFMAATAIGLNTTVEKLAAMSAVEQLDYVARYFQPYVGRIASLSDCYMAILYPVAIGKPENAVIFPPGSKAYLANKGLDVDHDGAVTKAEASQFVVKMLAEGMQAANAFEMLQPIVGETGPDLAAPSPSNTTTPKGKDMGAIALPLLAQLIPQVLGLFSGRAQAAIAEKTGADPALTANFMQALIAQVGHAVGVPVVDNATATQAVAALTAAEPEDRATKAKALEAQALATLDAMLKAGDKSAEWDAAMWAAQIAGRKASSSIAIDERKAGIWDMTRTVVLFAAVTLSVLVFSLLGALIYQATTGQRTLDSGLLGLSGPIFMAAVAAWGAVIAFRFDGTKQSSEQSKAVNEMIANQRQ